MKTTKNLPSKKISQEITRQPNEITRANFDGSTMSYKIILFALYKVLLQHTLSESNERECVFSQNEFCTKLGISKGSNTFEIIKKSAKDLSKALLILENEDAKNPNDVYMSAMPWFEKTEVLKDGSVKLKFNPSVAELFDFKTGYTALELLEVGKIQSFYALRYYGFARSRSGHCGFSGNKKNQWWFEFTEAELRQLFGIKPNEYLRRDAFVRQVIKNPCDEINRKTSINIDLEYTKLGVGNYRWRFICSNKAELFKISKLDSKREISDKQAINDERKKIARLQKEHPERWAELLEREMQKKQFGARTEDQQVFWATVNAQYELLNEFSDTF